MSVLARKLRGHRSCLDIVLTAGKDFLFVVYIGSFFLFSRYCTSVANLNRSGVPGEHERPGPIQVLSWRRDLGKRRTKLSSLNSRSRAQEASWRIYLIRLSFVDRPGKNFDLLLLLGHRYFQYLDFAVLL